MKYRKRPVVIEAWHRSHGAMPDWVKEAVTVGVVQGWDYLSIKTVEGIMIVSPDDWLIRDIEGEVYPCKPDIFEATYERVESEQGGGG